MTLEAEYLQRRSEIQVYFDRIAVDAWKRFASDAPLSRIRATVRKGRAEMRAGILSCLPRDLSGWRILDAGCGAGDLSVELARRGADVVGIDLSPEIIRFATDRVPAFDGSGRVTFCSGDMLAPDLGTFDAAIAMDSLIHYPPTNVLDALARLAGRVDRKIVFTFAPRTPLLAMMHAAGRLFPRSERAPSIEPVAPSAVHRRLAERPDLQDWAPGRTHRVSNGFYISQMLEVSRQ